MQKACHIEISLEEFFNVDCNVDIMYFKIPKSISLFQYLNSLNFNYLILVYNTLDFI